ncbi:MAG: VCBS repeat-containing protein, partial [Arenicella sp.]|nr:VCBS repeat-containing protein [Arenicella sp.]
MNQDPGDDQIIAVAFRRSLLVILLLLVVAGAWVLFPDRGQQQAAIDDVTLIAPQPVAVAGQVTPPAVQFTDITESAGLTHRHWNGAAGERLLPETMGGGVAVLDYNNDGAVDLLFINGQSWPWAGPQAAATDRGNASGLILYQGDGNGGFSDVTAKVGLNNSIYGMGAAAGDYDRDGYVDIFVTAVGTNRLYRNVNGKRFEEVTQTAGVSGADNA